MKLKTVTDGIATARKTIATVAGFVAQGVAYGLLSGAPLHWAQGFLAVATALGVYAVPNRSSSLLDA